MAVIMKERIKEIRLNLIIIQGKAKKCFYKPEKSKKLGAMIGFKLCFY